MTHTNGATRHTTPPAQLALIDTCEPAAPIQHPGRRLNRLRTQIAAELEILAAIQQAQDNALAEIAALAKQRPMVADELADELHFLMGSDNPHHLAERLGYTNLENLILRLRRNGLDEIAEQLKKPLKKPPAPYPSHNWHKRKPVSNG